MKTRSSFVLFLYCVGANLPLWIASRSLGLVVRGVFSIEFAAIGLLSLFVRRAVTVWLLLGAMVLDLLYAVCATYMLSLSDLMRSGGSVFEVVPSHLWSIAAIGLVMALICFLATSGDGRGGNVERRHGAGLVMAVLFVCLGMDLMTGQVGLLHPDRQLGAIRLTRSAVWSLKKFELQRWRIRAMASEGTEASVGGASKVMVGLERSALSASGRARPNVVLILVESWGKALSPELEESMVAAYGGGGIATRYTVSRGTVPFYGPTVAGEARELCGSFMGFGLLSASAAQTRECLPAKFDRMGYRTMGVHGFSSRMFDRGNWYRRIGFDDTWFRERLEGAGLPRCPGPFPGACDASVAEWVGDQLQRDGDSPQFIYWVTLNSHLPVPVPNLVKDPPACSALESTAKSDALCSWYQLIFNVHRSVAELAERPTKRPTVFVIVGDHAPPFRSPALRSQFSDAVVPYVLLAPKLSGGEDGPQVARSVVAAMPVPVAETRAVRFKRAKGFSRVRPIGWGR
jgi:hypothetical protein